MDDFLDKAMKLYQAASIKHQTTSLRPQAVVSPLQSWDAITELHQSQSMLSIGLFQPQSSSQWLRSAAALEECKLTGNTYTDLSLAELYNRYKKLLPTEDVATTHWSLNKANCRAVAGISKVPVTLRSSNDISDVSVFIPVEKDLASSPGYSLSFSKSSDNIGVPISDEVNASQQRRKVLDVGYEAAAPLNANSGRVSPTEARRRDDSSEIKKKADNSIRIEAQSCDEASSQTAPAAQLVQKDKVLQILFTIPKNEIIDRQDYKLIKEISKGSFGVVYAADWHGKPVAVKLAYGKMTLEAMRSVAREINAYRKLWHPQIVKYYGVCLDPSRLSIVTEFIPNGNLFDALYRNQVFFSSKVRIKMALQLAQVTQYLHEKKNLVHRDLKTANLILDENDNLKLCDFGKTREMNEKRVIKLEENGGSPRYMAPECFVSGNLINEKADIWSLGCCLIEIFGGPIPFEEMRTNKEVVHALLTDKRVPSVPPWFHPTARAIVNSCLIRDLTERTSAAKLVEKIETLSSEDLDRYGMNRKRYIRAKPFCIQR